MAVNLTTTATANTPTQTTTANNIATRRVLLSSWFPLTFFGLFITVWNGLLIIAFIINKKIRGKSSNILIFNFALTDFFVGVIYIPILCVSKYNADEEMTVFLFIFALYVTEFCLVLTAAERYFSLNYILQDHHLSANRLYRFIFASWIAGFILTMIPAASYYSEDVEKRKTILENHGIFLFLVFIILVPVIFVLHAITIVKAKKLFTAKRSSLKNVADAKVAIQTQTELNTIKEENKIILIFQTYTLLFFLCFLLQMVVYLSDFIGDVSSMVTETAMYWYLSKSIIFPVVALWEKEYRQTVYTFLGGR
ncbi:histamine H4 receptor-like [Hydractinia symbiolongicarpus]|uniref:histamine H4 receptor-like n=1 Tax=Hydractinia symbiolongicarpus TaxID=13093 RepID=UPI00254E7E93|nr:histamine H4 receptor-like [Hydractinia symbiolongicarpus]